MDVCPNQAWSYLQPTMSALFGWQTLDDKRLQNKLDFHSMNDKVEHGQTPSKCQKFKYGVSQTN